MGQRCACQLLTCHLSRSPVPLPSFLCRLMHIVKGGSWSPATHRLWPPKFKAALRTCLLAGQRPASPDSEACGLGALPPGVLLHIFHLAALPMTPWL